MNVQDPVTVLKVGIITLIFSGEQMEAPGSEETAQDHQLVGDGAEIQTQMFGCESQSARLYIPAALHWGGAGGAVVYGAFAPNS